MLNMTHTHFILNNDTVSVYLSLLLDISFTLKNKWLLSSVMKIYLGARLLSFVPAEMPRHIFLEF